MKYVSLFHMSQSLNDSLFIYNLNIWKEKILYKIYSRVYEVLFGINFK